MTNKFTQLDLVRFLYNETNTSETRAIKKGLKSDADFNNQYLELLASKFQVESAVYVPSKRPLDNIMKYVRSYGLKN